MQVDVGNVLSTLYYVHVEARALLYR